MSIFGTVERTERLSPDMVRVVLGGDGLADFEPTDWTDQYVNARFIPADADYTVPFDLDAVGELERPLRPVGRRITIRSHDADAATVTMDFVVHGDEGHAGRWAGTVEVGDRLQFTGPSGGYRPDPAADVHVFAGDESALPAIAASLEVLEEGSVAHAVLLTDDARGELELHTRADLRLQWVHRADAEPGDPDQLLRAVTELDLPTGRIGVFVHGEAAEVRSIRTHLVAERGIPKDETSISPYWRRGKNDEAWRKIKRDWITESSRMLDAELARSGPGRNPTGT